MRFRWTMPTSLVLVVVANTVLAEDGSFDSNGVRISYITEGAGEAIVLIHGFASSAAMWDQAPRGEAQVLSDLAKKFRVVALDCRGHGKSDKPHDAKQYGKEMIEDIVRLMDHLKIERAHVVGYSMGAEIAGHLMVAHPKRLLSVIMGGGVPMFEPSDESLARIELAAKSLEELKGLGPALIAGTPAGMPKPSPAMADAISRAIIGDQDQKALGASIRGSMELRVTQEQLKTNQIPVLLVRGAYEGLEEVRRIDRVASLLNVEVLVIPGDHVGASGSPEFVAALQTFIAKRSE